MNQKTTSTFLAEKWKILLYPIFAEKYQNTPSPRDDHSLETLKRHEKRKIFKKNKSMLYPFSWRNLCFTYKSLFENKRDFLAKKVESTWFFWWFYLMMIMMGEYEYVWMFIHNFCLCFDFEIIFNFEFLSDHFNSILFCFANQFLKIGFMFSRICHTTDRESVQYI